MGVHFVNRAPVTRRGLTLRTFTVRFVNRAPAEGPPLTLRTQPGVGGAFRSPRPHRDAAWNVAHLHGALRSPPGR